MAKTVEEWLAEGNRVKTADDCTILQSATREGSGKQKESHTHDWKPTSNGRYRCTRCFCHGYKLMVTGPYSDKDTDARLQNFIVEYTCRTNKCRGWAVAKDKKGYWRCPQHKAT